MKSLNYSIRIVELLSLGTKLGLYYEDEESLASDEYLSVIMPEINELSKNMTTAYNQDKIKSEFEEADIVRDEAVRSLGSLIEGYASFPLEAKRTAAKAIKAVFDKYGKKIVNSSYAAETGQINSLLEDLSAESLAESIAALDGMSDAIEALRTAQTAFDELDVEYSRALSQKTDSATSYRKPLLSAINDKLVAFLNVAVLIFPDKYTTYAERVETAINVANTTVTKRSNAAASSTDESTETTAE